MRTSLQRWKGQHGDKAIKAGRGLPPPSHREVPAHNHLRTVAAGRRWCRRAVAATAAPCDPRRGMMAAPQPWRPTAVFQCTAPRPSPTGHATPPLPPPHTTLPLTYTSQITRQTVALRTAPLPSALVQPVADRIGWAAATHSPGALLSDANARLPSAPLRPLVRCWLRRGAGGQATGGRLNPRAGERHSILFSYGCIHYGPRQCPV